MARGQNRHADSLATLASSMTEDVPRLIKLELIAEPSINIAVGVGVVVISTIESCWMDPIIDLWPKIVSQMMRRKLIGFAKWLLGTGYR